MLVSSAAEAKPTQMNHLSVCDRPSLGADFSSSLSFMLPPSLFLCSAQSVHLIAEQAGPHCGKMVRKSVCNPPLCWICLLCRSMMLNFSKWPCHACVPSLEPCLRTLWMPVLEQHWRNRRQWMHKATSIPNPSTLRSEWSENAQNKDLTCSITK